MFAFHFLHYPQNWSHISLLHPYTDTCQRPLSDPSPSLMLWTIKCDIFYTKIVVEHTDIPQEIFSLRFVKFEVYVTNLCYISFIFYRSLYSVKCDFVLLGRVLYIFCYDLQSFPFDTWGKQFISSKDIKVLFTRKTILPFNL